MAELCGSLTTWGAHPAGLQGSSMLLSFERPAPAGHRVSTSLHDVSDMRAGQAAYTPLPVLENCTEATSAAIDKGG
jgi:hypothetical protein